jgi:Sec-independent protein translocase protein TatA
MAPGRYHPDMGTDVLVVLIIILVLVVVWRGPKTLPLLGRALGQGVREARKEIDEMKGESAARKEDDPGSGGPPA